jgi:hypothetical protein
MNWKTLSLIAALSLTITLGACSSNPATNNQAVPDTSPAASKDKAGGAMAGDKMSKDKAGDAMAGDKMSKDKAGDAMKKSPSPSKP